MIFLPAITLLVIVVRGEDRVALKFPSGFKIGVGMSAYQSEGAWNMSDKGVSIWDDFAHRNPSPILDGSNGDVACDSYHKYKEDVAMLKHLGVDFYRFSLSWTRILPTGFANNVSKDGIRYYKNLLDDLSAQGIEPLVTIYHWDHPLVLEEMGGWTNELMVTWFTDYARVVFKELGGKVKLFTTINDPVTLCRQGYGIATLAPGKKHPKQAPYLCMHNILKAHAKAYRIYRTEFHDAQSGLIGISISCPYRYPKYESDTETPDIQYAFHCGWAANPIFSENGDYPDIMKRRIAENSLMEGYPRSRLPEFTQTEINEIKNSSDYFGLNHYTSVITEAAPKSNNTLWYNDSGVMLSFNDSWPSTAASWLRIMPQGLGDTLRQLKVLYNNPTIYILENGMPNEDVNYNDYNRIQFIHDYLKEVLTAVNEDGCNVKGYVLWCFIDNMEGISGYTQHWGLVNVDFRDRARTRTPKLSYTWFREVIRSRQLLDL